MRSVFYPYIEKISDPLLREFAKSFNDDVVPEYFYHIPASSSGKYHPAYSLGEGGLVRHTMGAVEIALNLFGMTEVYRFTDREKDMVLIALLFHDSFKSGQHQASHTLFAHPVIASDKILEHGKLFFIDEEILLAIGACISSHMGQWNTNTYRPSENTLPKPQTEIEMFVHLCDYLASRKNIEVIFS